MAYGERQAGDRATAAADDVRRVRPQGSDQRSQVIGLDLRGHSQGRVLDGALADSVRVVGGDAVVPRQQVGEVGE